jgi:hypothetical protein
LHILDSIKWDNLYIGLLLYLFLYALRKIGQKVFKLIKVIIPQNFKMKPSSLIVP